MELSTAQVSERLGVSQRQVQRLIAAGQLDATRRVGRSELVDAQSVQRLVGAARLRGRPWSESTAWAALWMLSSVAVDWVDEQTIHRLGRRLRVASPETLAWSCRSRAHVQRFRASESFLDDVRSRVCVSGASALRRGRDLMGADVRRAEGYCSPGVAQALVDEFLLVEDSAGNVTLRSTAFDRIPLCRSMPEAVVGIDLMESVDVREQAAGRKILEGALACLNTP